MDNNQVIGLEDGWNNEIKAVALDPLEVNNKTLFNFYFLFT